MHQASCDDDDHDDGGELHALWVWQRRQRRRRLPDGTNGDDCDLVCDDDGSVGAVDNVDNYVDDGDASDLDDENWSEDE